MFQAYTSTYESQPSVQSDRPWWAEFILPIVELFAPKQQQQPIQYTPPQVQPKQTIPPALTYTLIGLGSALTVGTIVYFATRR